MGGLAWHGGARARAAAPRPRPAPAARSQRAKTPRLAQDERRLLDLLAKKEDVAVVPADDDDGGGEREERARPGRRREGDGGEPASAFDACISRALRLNPALKLVRRATLVVTIQPSGTVAKAYVAEEEVDRTDLGACLSETARRMVFPAFDGEPVDVAMPLSLSAVF